MSALVAVAPGSARKRKELRATTRGKSRAGITHREQKVFLQGTIDISPPRVVLWPRIYLTFLPAYDLPLPL